MNDKVTMLELIERMCGRGVQVRILLTPNVLYDLEPPKRLSAQCAAEYAATYGPRFRFAERRFIGDNSHLTPDYDYRMYSTHQRYMAVDGTWALIGGLDVSKERTGSEITRSHEAEVLRRMIAESHELLYIENQYLGPSRHPDNKVLEALGERLVRAIRAGERFFVVLVTNLEHVDSAAIMRFTLVRNMYRALAYLERYLGDHRIAPDKLGHHFACASLRHDSAPIFIHSKVFIQDGRAPVTSSSNLIDRRRPPTTSLACGSKTRRSSPPCSSALWPST